MVKKKLGRLANQSQIIFNLIANQKFFIFRIVIAPWVSGSTLFSAEIGSNSDLMSLCSIKGMSLEIIEAFSEFSKILFPVQQVVIPSLVASYRSVLPPRDFVISAPTGSGKTLCFVLPILNALKNVSDAFSVYALVVAPTQSLASQIFTVNQTFYFL